MAEGLSVKPFRALTWTDVGGREAALVQRCAARDEDACADLVNEHQRMVYQLSLNLLGDHHEALDLSQEVFLRVFRTLPSFRGQSALKTWIYRIAINQARNRQRWWRRRRRSVPRQGDDAAGRGAARSAGHGRGRRWRRLRSRLRPHFRRSKPEIGESSWSVDGAGTGNRTPDLLITSEPLCRLSYPGVVRPLSCELRSRPDHGGA